ncbi:cupin domain-containing protein [Blastococcus sp. PRF04-17]|uniref:cupin domain-containing protein n=1 Tax=Blastococcus sp. PRF04-17 TaxID=2933797 RepID=UPI001FF28F49|nr:cupin domain-containing protein [Blastococcus sp. PRF04-17]UOY02948.1 cupin domain-containing protein [Blastococcus sp. PRF04-17]
MTTTPDCRIIRPEHGYEGRTGLAYGAGVSAESAGATGLCLHTLVVPPGGRGTAHLHEHHESAIYVISGEGEMWWGEGLAQHAYVNSGDFVYIPAGVPHLPANCSANAPLTAVVARTDPNEQESVVLLPELDALAISPGP